MPLFSSLKSKMRRDSTSSSTTNPNPAQSQISNLKDEKANNNLQASDVLGDSPSFKNGNGNPHSNGNGHSGATGATSSVSRARSPSESASSLRAKNSNSMLKMFSGTRSPSSASISSNTGSISNKNKRNSIMSTSMDNLGRSPSTTTADRTTGASSPPVSNSAVTAASLRSFNTNQAGAKDNNYGTLPTLSSTTAPGALLHAFNHPDATTPTNTSFGNSNNNNATPSPRPSDLFAGKAMEWGSVGTGREAPAPKAEDLQSFLKARRQWVPTFVTEEDAPSAAEKDQRLEDISFSSPETSTPAGVMSLKDLDASHERKRKLLGELPLTGGSIGGPSSVIDAATTSSTKGVKAKSKAPSSPPASTSVTKPSLASPTKTSPGKEKPGRSTSFRTSIFSSNKRTNSKDQSIPTVPSSTDQKDDTGKKGEIVTAAGAGVGIGGLAAVVATNEETSSRAPKSSADTQGTVTSPSQPVVQDDSTSNATSSTTNPESGSADVLTSSNDSNPQPSPEESSQRPASSRIRESIDSSAQGFQTPEAGSTRNSMALEEAQDNSVGDETVVNQSDQVEEGSKVEGDLPNLDDKDLENGEIVGTTASSKDLEPIQTIDQDSQIEGQPNATSTLSPEKPPRPIKAESRTPTTSRPPSPSTTPLKSDDTAN